MSTALWVAIALSALGTLLMRVVPFLWMQRRLDQREGPGGMPEWLAILGPLMIAAVLGVSIVPVNPSPVSWLATVLGLIATIVMWRRTRSLGWPVAVGVAVFGVVVAAALL